MQTSKYIANRKLATDYLKVAYQSISIHNKMLVATPTQADLLATHSINNPLSTKQLRFFKNDFNIMRAYQSNRNKVISKVHQFKKFIKLLFTYRVLGGYKNVTKLYAYSILITSDKRNYSVSDKDYTYYRTLDNGNNSIAVSNNKSSDNPMNYQIKDNTNNAIVHIHNAVSSLKKRISRLRLPLRFVDDSLVVKFGDVLHPVFPHVHGILLGSKFDTTKLSNKFSKKLSQYLGYDVSCSVNPLINKASKAPVIIDNANYNSDIDDTVLRSGGECLSKYPMNRYNPYYPIGFTMLYINKTKDLSFIGDSHGKRYSGATNDLQRWSMLPLSIKQKYIFGTYNSIHIRKYISDSLHPKTKFLSNRSSDYGIKFKTYGIRTHLFYQFKRKITKLARFIREYQIIHAIATVSVRINTATVQAKTLTATVRSQRSILVVREAIYWFKINYTYNTQTHGSPTVCLAFGSTFAFFLYPKDNIRRFSKNHILRLFNSS